MRRRETYRERTEDGADLHVTRIRGEVRHPVPVLLTHGTFSNAAVCMRLAVYLARDGFDCWVFELRGHGRSARGPAASDFEVWSELDVPAVLRAVRRETRRPHVLLIGHSGGGLVFLMHLARHPEVMANVKGVVTLASQATEAAASFTGSAKIVLAALANNVAGRLPGRLLGVGPEDESASVMNQWFGWNLRRRWVGKDGFDYLAALSGLEVPVLCLAGGGDHFIAPVAGCRRLFEAIGSFDKRLVLCARSEGFAEDYSHARIIASRAAQAEVWPQIAEWLAKRA